MRAQAGASGRRRLGGPGGGLVRGLALAAAGLLLASCDGPGYGPAYGTASGNAGQPLTAQSLALQIDRQNQSLGDRVARWPDHRRCERETRPAYDFGGGDDFINLYPRFEGRAAPLTPSELSAQARQRDDLLAAGSRSQVVAGMIATGRQHLAAGRVNTAMARFNGAWLVAPNDPRVLREIASAGFLRGDPPALTEAVYRDAMAALPGSLGRGEMADLMIEYAAFAFSRRQDRQAETLAMQAVETAPGHPPVYREAIAIHRCTGNAEGVARLTALMAQRGL